MTTLNITAVDDIELVPIPSSPRGERATGFKLQDQTLLLPRKQLIVCFCALSLALAVAFLDQLIITTALPVISAELGSGRLSSYVGSVYVVTSAACQPAYGRVGDILGRKAVLLGSLAIFMIWSLACALSKTMIQLIVFRALQGIGGGGLVTSVWIISSDIVSLRERGVYQSILQLVILISTSLGPILGGALASVSWTLIFWINLPIGAVAFGVIWYFVPARKVDGHWKQKLAAIDFAGTFLTVAGAVLVLLALNWGGVFYPWGSSHVLVPLFVGIATMGGFVFWEWKGARLPIVPLATFKEPSIVTSYILGFLVGSAYMSNVYTLPQLFQVTMGYSAVKSGVPLLPLQVVSSFAVMGSGFALQWTGRYKLCIVFGLSFYSIGLGLQSLSSSVSLGAVGGFLAITGLGMGMTFLTTLTSAQAAAKPEDVACVTSIREYVGGMGGALGLAVSGTLVNNELRSSMTRVNLPTAIVDSVLDDPVSIYHSMTLSAEARGYALAGYSKGFRAVFFFNGACIALAAVLAVLFIREFPLTREDEMDQKESAKEWLRSKGKRA